MVGEGSKKICQLEKKEFNIHLTWRCYDPNAWYLADGSPQVYTIHRFISRDTVVAIVRDYYFMM